MPSVDNLQRALKARIAASVHTLTVVYPPARQAVDGASPGPAPLNPFLGAPPPTPHIAPDTAPTVAPNVTVKCLWLDGQTVSASQRHQAVVERMGWYADADAVARVLASDVVTAPGQTCLDACDHVEHGGRHYVVLNVAPLGASFAEPVSYTVWLKTVQRQ